MQRNLLNFALFGGVTAAFCMVISTILIHVFGLSSQGMANTIAGIIGIALNYFLNSRFNFKDGQRRFNNKINFVVFMAVSIGGVALIAPITNLLIFATQSIILQAEAKRVAIHFTVLIFIALLSYIAHSKLSFRRF